MFLLMSALLLMMALSANAALYQSPSLSSPLLLLLEGWLRDSEVYFYSIIGLVQAAAISQKSYQMSCPRLGFSSLFLSLFSKKLALTFI